MKASLTDEIIDFLNNSGLLRFPLKNNDILGLEMPVLTKAERVFWGEPKISVLPINGRIIGYGAMGGGAAKLLPLLNGTKLEPTELWDRNADGFSVKKPDFISLKEDDLLLVFPQGKIENELRSSFANASFRVIYNAEVWEYLADELFDWFFI